MDRFPVKTTYDNLNVTFRLPRKGNSAIRIIAPKTKSRRPLELSPSEELARAFSQDPTEVNESWPKLGAPTQTHSSAASAPNANKAQTHKHADSVNVKVSRVVKSSSPDEELAISSTKAQLAKQKQTDQFPKKRDDLSPKNTVVTQMHVASQPSTPAVHTLTDPKNSSLDVYALNYVAQYFKAINESPAQIRSSIGLPSVKYAQYIASFAGFSLLQPLDPFICPSLDYAPPVGVIPVKDVDRKNYGAYLNINMHYELHAQKTELQDYNLYAIPFLVQNPAQSLYSFTIPGIRESTPRVDLGDTVLVRPWVCVPHEGLAELAREWYAIGGPKGVRLAPGFSGWEYRAVVWGLQRSKEQVVLRLDGFPPGFTRFCNISFIVQDQKCSPLYSAIARVARLLQEEATPTHWLQGMLFPAEKHGVFQNTLSKGSFDLPWYDKQLNFEQRKAVDAIIKKQYGAVPFIISGPPGTGKTKTLVEAALQLLHSAASANERCHLLICAPSDSAADTIATRLQAHLNRMELFRLNGWTRSFAEVPESLMLHSYTENDLFAIHPFATMMNFKVVVTTCRDAEMLVRARLTNVDLAVLTTQLSVIASTASAQPLRLHWSALLLDEAAQATEPEALIPLTVVQPGTQAYAGFHSLPQFIMAGDEHQLGPKLFSKTPCGLECTLFQRLFERDLYANHPLSRQKGSKPLTASMLPLIRPPFVNLVRNYRSVPAILTVPSKLFYHDTLIPEVTIISEAVASWQRWNGELKWPVLFVQNDSPDSLESLTAGNGTGAGALINPGEAVLAQELVKSLLNGQDQQSTLPALMPHEIAVISPFRAQVNFLRVAFRAAGLRGVNIGPLEAFQGLESKVVVICTTRTRLDEREPERFVRDDQARGIGLIGHAKKFNVALTRAKEGLIVIGDPRCLTCTGDGAWATFIAFCERNGCVEGDKLWTTVSSDVQPGRMEKALKYAANAKTREMKLQAAPTGFGYAEPSEGALRGHLLTADEAMWVDGMRLAEENEMDDGDADDEQSDGAEEAGEVIAETSATTVPNTVTANASGELISLSPEAVDKAAATRKEIVVEAEETMFDRDLEREIKKEGCEMQ